MSSKEGWACKGAAKARNMAIVSHQEFLDAIFMFDLDDSIRTILNENNLKMLFWLQGQS